jgi:3',5'-nucleoside bisphosphate phosphatase
VIDLHLHTTASDGRLSPAELVARVSAAGITTMGVTDHDTVAAVVEVTALATPLGIRVVAGIEVTAVDHGRDVHMLAYFVDMDSPALLAFLVRQRELRVARVREIGARLAALGAPVDVDGVLVPAALRPGASVGRPQLARALVAAGHVRSVQDAFDRLLATGQPAFVPRSGPTPFDVVRVVHDEGGLVSIAHPGVTKRDDLIAPLAEAGMDAIEAYHSDHAPDVERRYLDMADRLGLAVTGGSDFHGEDPSSPSPRPQRAVLGAVSLPADKLAAFEALRASRPGRP